MSTTHEGEELYRTAYSRLNAGQKRAVNTIEGPVVVMAGPGTGKTQVLTLRIAHILKTTDTPPDAILALTYTNSGVTAMRERLKRFIGHDAYRVNIHTFHGYASSVIEAYPDRFPRIIGATAADDIDRFEVMRAAIAESDPILTPSGDAEYYIRPALSLIGTLKSDNVSVDDYAHYVAACSGDEESVDAKGEPTTKYLRSIAFVSVYRAYEAAMRARKLYDYSDMLIELVEALERDEELRLVLGESAQYILADEHQDANGAQNRILELIASAHPDGVVSPNLFIVGDDKQAIYRFQGASLANFLYFQKRYPSAQVIALTENYRSTEAILRAAGQLMEGKALPGELIPQTAGGKPLTALSAPTGDEEVEIIADTIERLIKDGVEPHEVAVLVRKNRDIDVFARALRAREVPFRSHRDIDALATPEIVLLIALIRAVVDPHNDRALATALFAPAFALPNSTIAAILKEQSRRKGSLYSLLSSYDDAAKAYRAIEDCFKTAHRDNALTALDHVVTQSGFLHDVMAASELSRALLAYRSIRMLIETRSMRNERYTLRDAVRLLDDLDRGVAALTVADTARVEGVELMSLHKSKGLEFKHVFLPHALESRFKPRADRSLFLLPPEVNRIEPDWDDERRLFYVGITRAKHAVYVGTHQKNPDGREEKPLSFLAEVGEHEEVPHEPREPLRVPLSPRRSVREQREEYLAIVNAFFESGISATALNAYLEDPWKCFFKNILRLPETKAPHQMFGTAIHAALERMYGDLREGGTPTADALVAAFHAALAREQLTERDRAHFKDRGNEVLRGYYSAYEGTWFPAAETEVSVAVDLPLPSGHERSSVHIRGFIDRLDMVDGRARVTDYKTGKVKSRNDIMGNTASSDGSIYRQLVFYRLLLEHEGKRPFGEGVIDFVEPNQRGIYKRESFIIDDEAVPALVEDIARMVDDFSRGDFLSEVSESDDPEVRGLSAVVRDRFLT